MSLLNRIESNLQATPASPKEPDNIIDIDQRDSYIKACMGADVARQIAAAKGLNEATLQAAIKILCKWPDEAIRKKLGIAEEPELFTSGEWANKNESRRQTKTHR